MTRFARGKSTHQRVEAEPTSWTELKETPAKPDRKNRNSGGGAASPGNALSQNKNGKVFKTGNKPDFKRKNNNNNFKSNNNNRDKSKFNRHEEEESANFTPVGGNVKGVGQSKVVKIFGQFWVGPEDARRLQGLVKKLKAEGLPRKEIIKALQGEQRKAEKAAKRRRDKTCFSCRQFGHVLFDCPNLKGKDKEGEGNGDKGNSDGVGVGLSADGEICFKCGSTEHTSRFCRKKTDKFEFAKCFVCSQSGHIARQCPSNTNGIYPAGGCCDECGSVHHLKKDCPDVIGNGDDDNSESDPSAQVSRISNPFLSTEYEEIPDEPVVNEDTTETEVSSVPLRKQFKNAVRKQKGKSKPLGSSEEKEVTVGEKLALIAASSTSQQTLLQPKPQPPPPKKRKVVKF